MQEQAEQQILTLLIDICSSLSHRYRTCPVCEDFGSRSRTPQSGEEDAAKNGGFSPTGSLLGAGRDADNDRLPNEAKRDVREEDDQSEVDFSDDHQRDDGEKTAQETEDMNGAQTAKETAASTVLDDDSRKDMGTQVQADAPGCGSDDDDAHDEDFDNRRYSSLMQLQLHIESDSDEEATDDGSISSLS